jgi:hypothetical protein
MFFFNPRNITKQGIGPGQIAEIKSNTSEMQLLLHRWCHAALRIPQSGKDNELIRGNK